MLFIWNLGRGLEVLQFPIGKTCVAAFNWCFAICLTEIVGLLLPRTNPESGIAVSRVPPFSSINYLF